MPAHRVIREIERADRDVIRGLAEAGVATVYEAQGRKGLLGQEVKPIQQGSRIAGSAVTVLSAPGDNIMVHAAVEVVGEGDLLVIGLTAPGIHGMVGDLLAASLMAHGCIGLVSDSAVRDSAELVEIGFPVWCRAVHSAGTAKASPGSVNVDVTIAGVDVAPGDVVIADDDGVVVVARLEADHVLDAANARLAKEDETRRRLERGELGVDIYGLRSKLDELGVEYMDRGG